MTERALLIRRAEPADAATWCDLRTALWSSDDHAAEIAAYFTGDLSEPNEVLLAFKQDRPVGLLELSIRNDIDGAIGVRTGYIEGLYLIPAERNFRSNRALIDAAYRWALTEHCQAFASDRAGRIVLFKTLERHRDNRFGNATSAPGDTP